MESFKQQLIDPAKLLSKNKNPKSKFGEMQSDLDKERNFMKSERDDEDEEEMSKKMEAIEVNTVRAGGLQEEHDGAKTLEVGRRKTNQLDMSTDRVMANGEEEEQSTARQRASLNEQQMANSRGVPPHVILSKNQGGGEDLRQASAGQDYAQYGAGTRVGDPLDFLYPTGRAGDSPEVQALLRPMIDNSNGGMHQGPK